MTEKNNALLIETRISSLFYFITCYVRVNILLTGSVPHVNTSNHAPYFSIIILFSHECFVHLSMSVVALRAYALNKCIMINLMCHPRP